MSVIAGDAHSDSPAAGGGEEPAAVERRIFRGMCAAVAVAVASSAALFPWRTTTGLLLGGLLSLLNFHWLRTSVATMFGSAAPGARATWRLSRYVLRYVVVAAVVVAAYALDLVSLVAVLAGLCSSAAAVLIEGFTQLYFAVTRREET